MCAAVFLKAHFTCNETHPVWCEVLCVFVAKCLCVSTSTVKGWWLWLPPTPLCPLGRPLPCFPALAASDLLFLSRRFAISTESHEWNRMVYSRGSQYNALSLGIVCSRIFHVASYIRSSRLFPAGFSILWKYQFQYSFTTWRTFGLFSIWGQFQIKFNFSKVHWRAHVYVNVWLYSQPVFQNGCTILHSHWRCMWVPVPLNAHQHLILSFTFFFLHSDRYRVVSHCGFNFHLSND